MKNKTITILLIIAIIAIAFLATKIKKQTIIINEAPTIEVRILDKWCDGTPEIYECRTHKANNRRDK